MIKKRGEVASVAEVEEASDTLGELLWQFGYSYSVEQQSIFLQQLLDFYVEDREIAITENESLADDEDFLMGTMLLQDLYKALRKQHARLQRLSG
jgi:hypothetical protein